MNLSLHLQHQHKTVPEECSTSGASAHRAQDEASHDVVDLDFVTQDSSTVSIKSAQAKNTKQQNDIITLQEHQLQVKSSDMLQQKVQSEHQVQTDVFSSYALFLSGVLRSMDTTVSNQFMAETTARVFQVINERSGQKCHEFHEQMRRVNKIRV